MNFRLSVCLSTLALVVVGCHELLTPVEPALVLPTKRFSISGPDVANQVLLAAAPLSTVALPNYLYTTWVETRIEGYVTLTSLPGSVAAAGPVYAPGVWGNGSQCAMQVSLVFVGTYGYTAAPCGAVQDPRVDTVTAAGAAQARRGALPTEDYCGRNVPTSQCHTWSGQQYISVKPLKATLDSVTSRPRTIPSSIGQVQVVFTGFISPALIRVQGNNNVTPRNNTLWSYVDADDGASESNSCPVGGTAATCSPFLAKSGRMTLKSYVGGWEQTASVTVQCLLAMGDSALNDSTSDFKERGMILDMLRRSNNDSSVTAGFDVPHSGWSGGWRHETKIVVWRMPGGGFQTDTIAGTTGNACSITYYLPAPPVQGATVFATGHSHDGHPGEPLYCGDTIPFRGRLVPSAATPNDTLTLPKGWYAGDSADADRTDRNGANASQRPEYVISNGVVMRINPAPGPLYPNLQNLYRVSGGSEAERKCAWVKKLQ